MFPKHQLSASRRGYGAAHRRRRAALLPFAYGTPCPFCKKVMTEDQKLDLDHSVPLALGGAVGDRIVHSHCNRIEGAKLGNALSRKAATEPNAGTSRDW